jgi:hypothetical protein
MHYNWPMPTNPLDQLGDDPVERSRNFLDWVARDLIKSYQWIVVVLGTIFFVILAFLLGLFKALGF